MNAHLYLPREPALLPCLAAQRCSALQEQQSPITIKLIEKLIRLKQKRKG
jgi:hypothetical protein